MDTLINWLMYRMKWVYDFLVLDLGIPSFLAWFLLAALVVVFFYDLYDIFRHRNREGAALLWLLIVLLVPLGTLIYLFGGRQLLHNAQPAQMKRYGRTPKAVATPKQKAAVSTIGSIVGGIALVAGVLVLVFLVFIVIAYIQCMNDPKCM